MTEPSSDRMPEIVTRCRADRDCLQRLWSAPYSPRGRERLRAFWSEWRETLDDLPFDELSRADRVDWIALRTLIEGERRRLDREERQFAEMEPLLPFAADLIALEDERRSLADVDAPQATFARAAAERLDRAAGQIRDLQGRLKAERAAAGTGPGPTLAHRAAETLDAVGKALESWFTFHHAYNPLFTWWAETPYRTLQDALRDYGGFLHREIAGAEDEETILGDPIGADALREELERNGIPYTPEELIAIGRREMDWCAEELRRAAGDMGHGDDWRAALEQVKNDHVAPGEQPALVRDLAHEAIRWVEERDLITVPPLAAESWRMEMMSPERQKHNPFFLGGPAIIVSFPTNGMEHAQKQMSLRGNNRHFARTTVHHELIPGHCLQWFSQERYRPYRRMFATPFWTEGWTLHWEMLLWDLGFARTPEERVGMLFWRMHRGARVLFSLGFHLGQMTARECVDLLVDAVGHERDNALAEVRRSLGGAYDPLYQCAYLIGGLQVRALHRELVGSAGWTHRQFHDAFLRENCLPIALLRALLNNDPLPRDFRGDWRFDAG